MCIWLRIREFWEWKAAIDLAFGSQARLAVMADSSFAGLSGFIQNGRVELANMEDELGATYQSICEQLH